MTGIEHLKSIAISRLRTRYPSVPVHALPVPKYSDKKANALTKCIIDFVNFNGGMAERVSNTGRWLKGETVQNVIGITRHLPGQYIPGAGLNGTADISATIRGRSVAIEVKVGRDMQSEAQKEYQQRIENAGGLYFIARNFEEFYEWYCDKFK